MNTKDDGEILVVCEECGHVNHVVPSAQPTHDDGSNALDALDCVSRQALCDDLREYKVHPVPISSDESEVKGYNDGIDLAISVIAEFPSAQPEPSQIARDIATILQNEQDMRVIAKNADIVLCEECKWWYDIDGLKKMIGMGACCYKLKPMRLGFLTPSGWFCADGERKDEANCGARMEDEP